MTMSNGFKHLDNGVTVIYAYEYRGMRPYEVLVSTVRLEMIVARTKYIYITRSGGKKPYARVELLHGDRIGLHQYLEGIKKGDSRHVHHKDGDSLNNCDDNIIVLTRSEHDEIESLVIRGPRINERYPNNSVYDFVKQSAKSTIYGVNVHKYRDDPHRQALLDVIGSYIVKHGHDDSEIMRRLQRLRQSPVYAGITEQSIIDDISYMRERLGIPAPIVV